MGRQRLGGTRSKIRGKVGDNIYQIKSVTGSFVQHVYKAPESRENPNTEAQAKARMVMGQIQRMFHALPSIIKDAWIDAPRGRISFQRFAQINRPLLMDDVENHWAADSIFDWQPKYSLQPPAGEWILTAGQLPEITPDGYKCTSGVNNEFEFTFNGQPHLLTYGHLLSRLSMTRNSQLYIIFYEKIASTDEPRINVLILSPNPAYGDEVPLSQIGDDEFFINRSDWDVIGLPTYGKEEFSLQVYKQNPGRFYYVACCALFVVQRGRDNNYFSSSRFRWAQKQSFYYRRRNAPAAVWSSWFNN